MKDRLWSCGGPLHINPLPDDADTAARMTRARKHTGWKQELCSRCGIQGWREPGADNGLFTRQNLRTGRTDQVGYSASH